MPREILWTDAEEIGIQLQEKFPALDPFTVRFTDLHKYVTELDGFADDPAHAKSDGANALDLKLLKPLLEKLLAVHEAAK